MEPHHDSGYFPGLSNAAARLVLGAAGVILALVLVGIAAFL